MICTATVLYIILDQSNDTFTGSEFYQEKVAHETYAETRRRVFIETKNIKNLCEKLDQHGMSAAGGQRT